MPSARSCSSWIMLPAWTTVAIFRLSVFQRTLLADNCSTKTSDVSSTVANPLQVEHFLVQFLWKIAVEAWIKATQSVADAFERTVFERSKGGGEGQNNTPLRCRKLSLQNGMFLQAWMLRNKWAFKEKRELMTWWKLRDIIRVILNPEPRKLSVQQERLKEGISEEAQT